MRSRESTRRHSTPRPGAYAPYVVAKLSRVCIDDTFWPFNHIINGLKIVYIDDTISTVNDYINFRI